MNNSKVITLALVARLAEARLARVRLGDRSVRPFGSGCRGTYRPTPRQPSTRSAVSGALSRILSNASYLLPAHFGVGIHPLLHIAQRRGTTMPDITLTKVPAEIVVGNWDSQYDVRFEVKDNEGERVGEFIVSRGGVGWRHPNKQSADWLSWPDLVLAFGDT